MMNQDWIELLSADENANRVPGMRFPTDRGGAVRHLPKDFDRARRHAAVEFALAHREMFVLNPMAEPVAFYVPDDMDEAVAVELALSSIRGSGS